MRKSSILRYYYYCCYRLDNSVKFYLSEIKNEAKLMVMPAER